MTPTGRPKRQVGDDERDRWAELRLSAAKEANLRRSDSELGLSKIDEVAWLAGLHSLSDDIDEAIEAARSAGATWSVVAVALGESGDDKSTARVKSKFLKRAKERHQKNG